MTLENSDNQKLIEFFFFKIEISYKRNVLSCSEVISRTNTVLDAYDDVYEIKKNKY